MTEPLDSSHAAGASNDATASWLNLAPSVTEYLVDATQRTILFWDTLRRRSDLYYEQKAQEVPHVLNFEAELVVDGRTLERPANYLLVRIQPPAGTEIDAKKRPFVVVDPRAGHGPGIGGFKADSEIGFALRAGHDCYFIGFTPDPVPGQTIEDVLRAEAVFLEKVIDLHPKADGKPCIIGNCQAGWAVMMLAAVRPDLCGPIIVAGAPLSYWAGVHGKNPMRYTAGLLGGSWMTELLSDLGNGRFDGGYLVENFENLNPANTLWSKYYNVWSNVDKEADRFLGFERWWGHHVNLNAEEIQWIVDELFVGNRLATSEITTSDGVRIDLRNIKSPILCFASEGDNITPPQQALGWIVDLYEDDDDIKVREQTIIYMIHAHVGHLGIFVSGSVAKKEHSEFTSNIDLIDILPPGIYEAVLIPVTPDVPGADLAEGDWIIRFERRTLADVREIVKRSPSDERRFAAVQRFSDVNLGLYRTFLQPWVQMFSSEEAAKWLRMLQPAYLPYPVFSDQNPLMQPLADAARQVRERRTSSSPENPLVHLQDAVSSVMVAALDGWRDWRDMSLEQLFLAVYGNPVLQALAGLKGGNSEPRRRPGNEPETIEHIRARLVEIRARLAEGGAREAAIRGLVYVAMGGTGWDERRFSMLQRVRAERQSKQSLTEFKATLREQFFALMLDEKAALEAIPKMLPDDKEVTMGYLDALRRVVMSLGKPGGTQTQRLAEIERLFGMPA